MAKQVVELTGDEAALLRSYNKAIEKQAELEARLRAGGQTGDAAGTQIEDALARIQRANDSALKGLLGDLKQLGPEGATAADALKGHFTETGKLGYKSFEQILDQIRAIDPTAADAAAAARNALNDAANSSERQFRDVLDEMRALGPEGKKAADEIKASLVAAGKLSEKSIEDIAGAFDKIDPEAAKAARAVISNMKEGTTTSTSMFTKFRESAVAELTAVAAGYTSVAEAIQSVTQFLQDQREVAARAAKAHETLAVAQQNAVKNLSGLNADDRALVMDVATRIKGVDPKFATQAVGEVASTGVTDPAQIISTVEQSSRINQLTPEELPALAAGSADIQAKTGLTDVRQAIALMTTTGAASRVDAAELQNTLPRALATVATVPGQSKEDAAREIGAFFSGASNSAVDATGASTATFSIDFVNRLDSFFDTLDRERVKARSEIEQIDRKIKTGSDTEFDRLRKQELESFVSQSDNIKDPGKFFDRLAILQQNAALGKEFLGESGFGEKQFSTFLKDVLDPNSEAAKNLLASKEQIRADVDTFERLAEEMKTLTPQMSLAIEAKRTEATLISADSQLTDRALTEAINQEALDVLSRTRSSSFNGWTQWATDWMGGSSASVGDAALQNIIALQARAQELRQGGVTREEATLITTIERTIENIFGKLENRNIDPQQALSAMEETRRTMQGFTERVGPQGQLIQGNKEVLTLLERLGATLERIAASNQAMVDPTKATAANTGQLPPATPALSAQQP